jgi:uncharacterized protein
MLEKVCTLTTLTSQPLRSALRQPLPTAFHVMTKPIGPICNLDCRYCFYLEKEDMYRQEGRHDQPSWQMPDDLLESYVRQYIEQQSVPEISFAWQGGEPTLLGVGFFRKVVEFQKRYAGGKRILNALQTNGTRLDDEWGDFLASNDFLVGISIDGPRELHNTYRVDKQGKPTFDSVLQGMEMLRKHAVEFNTLTVVNRANSLHPERVYRFLKDIGSGFIQFIPLVEREATGPVQGDTGLLQIDLAPPPTPGVPPAPVTEWSVRPDDWGRFLTTIFDNWVRQDVGRIFVQYFDVALGIWSGMGSSICVFSETCGKGMALEHNGDLYSCDHYVYPAFRLGNLRETPLKEMAGSPQQVQFGNDKRDTLPRYCRECEVRFACNGECPKHRFLKTPEGEPGLNYLCAGYKRFFTHIAPYMEQMSALLQAGRPPAEIMDLRRREPGSPAGKGVGRNDSCPCGSGKKYKKCCMPQA